MKEVIPRFFPRLIHIPTFHAGLVPVVGKEEKQAALVEYLTHSSCSLKDGVSVQEAEQFKDQSLRTLSVAVTSVDSMCPVYLNQSAFK